MRSDLSYCVTAQEAMGEPYPQSGFRALLPNMLGSGRNGFSGAVGIFFVRSPACELKFAECEILGVRRAPEDARQ